MISSLLANLGSWIFAFFGSFHPKALPAHLRRNYGQELLAWSVLPIMLAGVQGGAMAVILKKTFTDTPGMNLEALALAVATVTTSTAIGNLTSGIWAVVANGRPKVPIISILMGCTSLCVLAMAFVPFNAFGAWTMVALVVLGWIFWSGVITIRTTIWRKNYPDADRAKIAGRLATVQVLMMAVIGYLLGLMLDRSVEFIRIMFPILGSMGIIGAIIYSRVRLRGQRRLMRAELASESNRRPSANPLSVVQVLTNDNAYAAYMGCMMCLGFGNLMNIPVLALVLADRFDANYEDSLLLSVVIPSLVIPMAIPIWARFLDRVHVITFRSVHSWVFVSAATLYLVAIQTETVTLMFLASIILGIGFAGGMLAWNLGHQHFAPAHRDAEYMSAHVMLTGLRGLIAPFAGVAIYEFGAKHGFPAASYAAGLSLTLGGAFGFYALRRWHRRTIQAEVRPTT